MTTPFTLDYQYSKPTIADIVEARQYKGSISKLIQILQSVKDTYGDLDIEVCSDDGWCTTDLTLYGLPANPTHRERINYFYSEQAASGLQGSTTISGHAYEGLNENSIDGFTRLQGSGTVSS
jgi:hypothetical protein